MLEKLSKWLENWEEVKLKLDDAWGFFFVNIPYFLLWLLYFILFANLFGFWVAFWVYAICLFLAFIPLTEYLFYVFGSYRPLRTNKERQKLEPIFNTLKDICKENNMVYKKEVFLYIQDSMEINAFAFGRQTLCVSRGALKLLSEEQLMAVICHEMGHLYHGHTTLAIMFNIAVLPFSIVVSVLSKVAYSYKSYFTAKKSGFLFSVIYFLLTLIPNAFFLINDLISLGASRRNEYQADLFAFENGLSEGLLKLLYNLDKIHYKSPEKLTDYLQATHPPLTKRIEAIERKEEEQALKEGVTTY